MQDYLYNNELKEIFIYDDLQNHKLNETGALIFDCLQQGLSYTEAANHIVNSYEIDLIQAEQDVLSFIREMEKLGVQPQINQSKNHFDEFDLIPLNLHLNTPILHIIQNCNSPCKMCDCWQTKSKTWHSAEKLRPLFHKLKELGALTIMVSGGEPLLHPELPEILSDLKKIGLQIMLNTNGLLLHKNAWIADYDIEQLVVSMDGYNSETYKIYRGLDGYDIVWKNLEAFQKVSPLTKIGIRTTLNKYNYDKVDLLFDAIDSRGMHSVGFSPADVTSTSFSRNSINQERTDKLISLMLPSEQQISDFLDGFLPSV